MAPKPPALGSAPAKPWRSSGTPGQEDSMTRAILYNRDG